MITSFLLLALKSLLIAAITLGVLRLNARRSAAERSTIAHLGLFALVAVPFASLALPPLSIALPAPAPVVIVETIQAGPIATDSAMAAPTIGWSDVAAQWTEMLAPCAYLLPAMALLGLTGLALRRLTSLRARAQVMVDPGWLGALARAQRRMGFKNGTALLISDELSSPISWGLVRPTIVLNAQALDATAQAEAIIAHELAHVIQRDWAKLMLARIATAVFWFNPLAWVLANEAHQLREEAADDAVLAADITGPDYAQLLVGIARHEARTFLLTAHGVAPNRNSLRRRIARVLDASPARHVAGPSWVAGFTTGMLVMATPLAAVTFGRAAAPEPPAKLAVATPIPAPANNASPVQTAAPVPAPAPRATPVPRKHAKAAVPAEPETEAEAAPMAAAQLASEITDRVTAQFSEWPWRPRAQPRPQNAPAPTAQPMPTFAPAWPREAIDGETLQMRAVGVTPEFQKQMADVGFPNLSLEQLVQARSIGLNCGYIEAMRKAGLGGDFNTFIQARAVGLTPGYVQGMRAAGVQANPVEFQQMRAVGVTLGYVAMLRSRGISVTAPYKLIQLKAVGFDPMGRHAPDP